jgi:gliding motility-associated protein GldM
MAGGKETPRQKMIGMMYLVLTALLALNVSKTILDAFVNIEENIQKSNISHHDRGTAFSSEVNSEIKTTPNTADNFAKIEKLKIVYKKMQEVDKLTAPMIVAIDNLKIELLKESKEAVDVYKDRDENTILWKKYDPVNYPCLPVRMNLMAVQGKDEYDIPMDVLIGEDIRKPNGKGMDLWKKYLKYRADLVECVGTYKLVEKPRKFKSKEINEFNSNLDLVKKVKEMVNSNKQCDIEEDGQVLEEIYLMLTKSEFVKSQNTEGKVHWIGAMFDHVPIVACLATLSTMQQEILSARAMALSHLKSKVSTGEYSFNKILPLAYGPEIATAGDDIELRVMMAAFDSDNQPEVTGPGQIKVDGGQGIIKLKAGATDMTLSGTVSIKNKSGVKKTEKWTHEVKIMQPQANASLPEMNVLYRGYENKLMALASGYDQTVPSISNGVSMTPSTFSIEGKQIKGYIVKPSGPSRECTVSISGQNSITKKTVNLGSFKFRVKDLPPPTCYFGKAPNGGRALKGDKVLSARYEDSPLNASFTVVSWEMEFMGRSAQGTGNVINAQAEALLKQAKTNSTASFLVKYRGPDKKDRQSAVVVKF